MASSLKRLIFKKISDAARNNGLSISVSHKNILQDMFVSSAKNDWFEIGIPIKALGTKFREKLLPSALSIEADGTVEKIRKNDEELVFSINRAEFVKEIISKYVKDKVVLDEEIKREKEKFLIEFSSPNIAKPFHLGHLRSTIIGNFIANIHEVLGHDVTRVNYLGDWGTQFGLLSVGLKCEGISDECMEKDPINLLYSVYVKVNEMASQDSTVANRAREIFHSLEEWDTVKEESKGENVNVEDLQRWEKIRKYTEKELRSTYIRLGVKFDEYAWESDYRMAKILPLLLEMEKKHLLETDDSGKKVTRIDGFTSPVTLVKSDGTTLYLTRDVACALDRHERYNFDRLYYVVDNGQSNHFTALFSILERLGLPPNKNETNHPVLTHIKFGRVQGMSTRRGTSVFLKDILDEAKEIMKKKILISPNTKVSMELSDETADILGTSAVIVNDLKQRRQKDYKFDWNRVLQVDGDTGIKLQYTHCRLSNLEKNCGVNLPLSCEPSYLPEPEVTYLIREIARYNASSRRAYIKSISHHYYHDYQQQIYQKFEDVIIKAYEELEACHLVVYLFQLCNHINRAFKMLQVKGQGDVGCQRLLLFHVSRLVLGFGMRTLGLKPLENM